MSWFGHDGAMLARALDLPLVVAHGSVDSTMDTAHALAAQESPAGTLVVAEEQRRGRGRGGKQWQSARRAGIWMTLIERPRSGEGLDVLSLRVGLALAPVLERWTPSPICVKWPNDLLVDGRKLAGILIEARWRDARPDWVCIGIGVNLIAPADLGTALVDANPFDVLAETVPAVRRAAFAEGALSDAERAELGSRDVALSRVSPT